MLEIETLLYSNRYKNNILQYLLLEIIIGYDNYLDMHFVHCYSFFFYLVDISNFIHYDKVTL